MKEEVKKELAALDSSLDKVKIRRPTAPEGYFAKMQDSIMNDILAEAKPEPSSSQTSPFWSLMSRLFAPRPALAFAGMLALAIAIFFAIKPSDNLDSPILASLEVESTGDYINYNIDDYDIDLLADYIDEYDGINSKMSEDIEDEYLEEVLYDLDLNDLEEIL